MIHALCSSSSSSSSTAILKQEKLFLSFSVSVCLSVCLSLCASSFLPLCKQHHHQQQQQEQQQKQQQQQPCNIKTRKAMLSKFSDWLNLFNGELSLKRYWRGPRFQEVGEEGEEGDYLTLHFTTRMSPALRWAAMRAIFNV